MTGVGLRVVLVAGLGLLVAGATVVPLPYVVSTPGSLVAVADAATVEVRPGPAGEAARPQATDGTYLRVAEDVRPSLLAVTAAAVRPDQTLRRPIPQTRIPQFQPATMAALIGMGLSPARMQGAPLPVAVTVDPAVDATSLAVALQIVDTTLERDAARGRTIAGAGSVAADGSLLCTVDPVAVTRAASEAGADMVVLPAACDAASDGDVEVIAAQTLVEAVQAVAAGGAG